MRHAIARLGPVRIAAVLALAACASTGPRMSENNDEHAPTPEDVATIPIYWGGRHPDCAMERVHEVSAGSENGLRWGAWNYRANAVVGVRSRLLPDARGQIGTQRIYEGVAVRVPRACLPAS